MVESGKVTCRLRHLLLMLLTKLKTEENLAQKGRRQADQLTEIRPGSNRERIDPIAYAFFESVAIHSLFAFQMIDTRLHLCTTLNPTIKAFGRPTSTPLISMDLNHACVSEDPMPHVNKNMIGPAGNPLHLLDRIFSTTGCCFASAHCSSFCPHPPVAALCDCRTGSRWRIEYLSPPSSYRYLRG